MPARAGKRFVPPPELFPAREDYAKVARALFDVLVDVGEVQPGERVLDVGCGTGRLAAPLVDHLGPEGSYEGFDMDPKRIEWCNTNIAPLHPNFRFQAIDVYNAEEGRREGARRAGELTFPYPDDEFDLAFLFSVFTHMMPDGVERYLSELARVLRPGGRALITWFLLNEDSLRALDEQRERRHDPAANALEARFGYDCGVYRITNRAQPTTVVAFDESFARAAYRRAGLKLEEPIRYGGWTGRKDAIAVQDVVLARRPAA